MKKSTDRTTLSLAAALLGLLFCFQPVNLAAVEQANEAVVELPPPLTDSDKAKTDYLYEFENRTDPFRPFISEKAAPVPIGDPDRILEPTEQLTGMQLFEPGQLTLVAIVMGDTYDFAMVEDTIGKGYVIRTGTKVGKRGEVTIVEPNRVVIEETAYTQTGKKLTSNVVMLLKKEGEE